jgi:hypothetical protein
MIDIPISQQFRFRPIDTNLPNFDNTFISDSDAFQVEFTQYVNPIDTLIQTSWVNDGLRYAAISVIECDGTETVINTQTEHVVGIRIYRTFRVSLGLFEGKRIRLKVYEVIIGVSNTESHLSEWVYIESQPKYLQVEWWNVDNAFMLDYSDGLTNVLQLDAKQWKLTFGGESSVYSNQGIETKLKEIVNRVFILECDLPDYLCETLTLAMAHDHFYINEIEFVTTKKPVITQRGTSSIYAFSAEVQQRAISGINKHNV